jgi:hypothetical protein
VLVSQHTLWYSDILLTPVLNMFTRRKKQMKFFHILSCMPSSDTIVSYMFVCSAEHAKWVTIETALETNVQSSDAPSTLGISIYFCAVLRSEYKIKCHKMYIFFKNAVNYNIKLS